MSIKVYNYLLKIEYDGTNFVGWQHQKNGVSIQEKIEKALQKILKLKIRICSGHLGNDAKEKARGFYFSDRKDD